jgi:ketosteroid isomerase-like protein
MIAPQERYRRYLETLSPRNLEALPDYVTPDVRFKDPFNDVRGADAMSRVFRHMFENVAGIRFTVRNAATDGDVGLMTWRFEGTLKGKPWAFEGASSLRFAADGRVAEHIDYWDAAGDFYERLPIIGWLLSSIRRRLATD